MESIKNFFWSVTHAKPQSYIIALLVGIVVIQSAALANLWLRVEQYKQSRVQDNMPIIEDISAEEKTSEENNEPRDTYGYIGAEPESFIFTESIHIKWNPELTEYACDQSGCNTYSENKYYDAGEVLDGNFASDKLILRAEETLGASYTYYALTGAGLKELKGPIAGIDDAPEVIDFPDIGYQLNKYYAAEMINNTGFSLSEKLFTDPVLGDFYLASNGCIMTELPDHRLLSYDLDIPFVGGGIDIVFNDGTQNNEEYTYTRMGCGSVCRQLALIDEKDLKPTQRLSAVGKAGNGDDIYAITNPQDSRLKNLYEDKGTIAYYTDKWDQLQKNKYTYEEFLSHHPYLYWQDPLGRWIEFANDRFRTAAEMCKPVIYLYPEQTTAMSVFVEPNGGFTHSEPMYNNGWQVQATPESRITDLNTGQEYDYLFWEGIGLDYPHQENGWVIAQSDVSGFFDEKLSLLGLNQKEANDFKEYWVPRLSDKPYYHLRFLSKQEFSKLAPMNIVPNKPNTVIRVMLTAKGLDVYKETQPQEFPPFPARDGFTVVEWGGTVLR